jgi:hypothetical protein
MIKNILLLSFFIKLYSFFYPEDFGKLVNKCKVYYSIAEPYLISSIYNSIWAIGYCQIKLNKLRLFLEPNVKFICTELNSFLSKHKIISTSEQIKTIVSYYDNGNIIKKESYKNNIYNIDNVKFSPDSDNYYDLITINQIDSSINNIYCLSEYQNNINFNLSNIKFLSLECKHKDKTYNIELKNDKVNFYFNEFIIDENFIKYYIKNILDCKEDIDDDEVFEYTLHLIDHNVVINELEQNKIIIIKENDYVIEDINSSSSVTNTDLSNEEETGTLKHSISEEFIKLE